MKRIYLGLWEKYGDDNEYHLEAVNRVIRTVETFGEVSVIFNNEISNHRNNAFRMAIMLPSHYNIVIKKDQSLKISKS